MDVEIEKKLAGANDETLMEVFPFVIPKYSKRLKKPGGGFFIEIRDTVPDGWWKAFGVQMLVDMREALQLDGRDSMFLHGGLVWRLCNALLWVGSLVSPKARRKYHERRDFVLNHYHIYQCKEKFDRLVVYGGVETDDENDPFGTFVETTHLEKVLDEYERESTLTCAMCGHKAEYVSHGWYLSFCTECAFDQLVRHFGLDDLKSLEDRIKLASIRYMPLANFIDAEANDSMEMIFSKVESDWRRERR